MKKCLAAVLSLLLLLALLPAQADTLNEEEFLLLGETGLTMWISPELKAMPLDEETAEAGYLGYFEDEKTGSSLDILLTANEEPLTVESYAAFLKEADTGAEEIKIETINGIPCVTWLFPDETTAIKQLAWVSENNDLLVLTFIPYSDPVFAAKTDAMINSLKKAQ